MQHKIVPTNRVAKPMLKAARPRSTMLGYMSPPRRGPGHYRPMTAREVAESKVDVLEAVMSDDKTEDALDAAVRRQQAVPPPPPPMPLQRTAKVVLWDGTKNVSRIFTRPNVPRCNLPPNVHRYDSITVVSRHWKTRVMMPPSDWIAIWNQCAGAACSCVALRAEYATEKQRKNRVWVADKTVPKERMTEDQAFASLKDLFSDSDEE
ncbi:hypothetical protein AAVH_29578 [Aphelenchoides avenae]|nr:hypothetical protein AAVH_29578 [Aphelenchus avenae]